MYRSHFGRWVVLDRDSALALRRDPGFRDMGEVICCWEGLPEDQGCAALSCVAAIQLQKNCRSQLFDTKLD